MDITDRSMEEYGDAGRRYRENTNMFHNNNNMYRNRNRNFRENNRGANVYNKVEVNEKQEVERENLILQNSQPEQVGGNEKAKEHLEEIQGYKKENLVNMILYGALALLFQPFFKISLGRDLWNIVDVIVGCGLIVSIFIKRK